MSNNPGSLVVLASYPKSGSTWLRRFIGCYSNGYRLGLKEMMGQSPFIGGASVAAQLLGEDFISKNKDPHRMLKGRPEMFQKLYDIAQTQRGRIFVKTHSADGVVFDIPQISHELVQKYIYVVRHPADVLPAYAYHMSKTVEETWPLVQSPTFVIKNDELDLELEVVSSWPGNVGSWLPFLSDPNFLLIRYEDMKLKPLSTFKRVIEHLDLPYSETLLLKSLQWSQFEEMKKEESEVGQGFGEHGANQSFFRRGATGEGIQEIPRPIYEEMLQVWGPMMTRLNYI